MLELKLLRYFNPSEILGIWFSLVVFASIVAYVFDWLMQKTGIGLVAGTAATLLSLIGGLHLTEWFIRYQWRRDPVPGDTLLIIAMTAAVVVTVMLSLSISKRKVFDN
ncbi:MAG: hypothetical protein ACRCYS_00780 [Beijerinckiaceae bacterium]